MYEVWQQGTRIYEFDYKTEGRTSPSFKDGKEYKVSMSPECWAQCEFPQLRNGGNWLVKKVKDKKKKAYNKEVA